MFLRLALDTPIDDIQPLKDGMFSQAFAFAMDGREYVLRINEHLEDFQKDAYAHDRFTGPDLPIPAVVTMGQFDMDRYYCITERCPGETLDALGADSRQRIAPDLLDKLDALHARDVSDLPGWGLTDARGEGRFASWPHYLRSFYNQKFDFSWQTLIRDSLLERPLYMAVRAGFEELLTYVPQEKWLVHGDYGFDNVVAAGRRITGVLDWAEMRLGDFVYDIAYLDFWSKDSYHSNLWLAQAQARGQETPHFQERRLCYMLHQALGGLAIAAIQNDAGEYAWLREYALKLAAEVSEIVRD